MALTLTLLAVALAVTGGDVLLRTIGARIAADRLAGPLHSRPHVVLHGWGTGWRLATWHVRHATIEADGVPAGGEATLSHLRAELWGVALPRDGQPLTADRGRFEAWLSPEDVDALIDLPIPMTRLELTDGGVRVAGPAGLGVDATLDVDGGELVAGPRGLLQRALRGVKLTIPLGALPAGAEIEEIDVRADGVRVRGPLRGDRLTA